MARHHIVPPRAHLNSQVTKICPPLSFFLWCFLCYAATLLLRKVQQERTLVVWSNKPKALRISIYNPTCISSLIFSGTLYIHSHATCTTVTVSMGKLVNPFASHAKDPRFEPEWRHTLIACVHKAGRSKRYKAWERRKDASSRINFRTTFQHLHYCQIFKMSDLFLLNATSMQVFSLSEICVRDTRRNMGWSFRTNFTQISCQIVYGTKPWRATPGGEGVSWNRPQHAGSETIGTRCAIPLSSNLEAGDIKWDCTRLLDFRGTFSFAS